MSFHVIAPPSDEAKFAEVAKQILEDAVRLGMVLEANGFLNAWSTNTRVVVEKQEGVVVSMAMVASGMQWNQGRATATVLEIRGNIEATLEFVKLMATAMGAGVLITEKRDFLPSVVEKVLARMQANPALSSSDALAEALENDLDGQRLFSVVETPLE